MIELLNTGAYLVNGIDIIPDTEEGRAELKARTGAVPCPADAAKETIAYGILKDHNVPATWKICRSNLTNLHRMTLLLLESFRPRARQDVENSRYRTC